MPHILSNAEQALLFEYLNQDPWLPIDILELRNRLQFSMQRDGQLSNTVNDSMLDAQQGLGWTRSQASIFSSSAQTN